MVLLITSERVRVSPPPQSEDKRSWARTAVFVVAAFFAGLVFRTGPKTTVLPGENLGPRKLMAGVPVGYARTPDGAMGAAGNYVSALDGPLLVKEDTRTALIRAVVAAETQAERLGLVGATAESNRRVFGDDWQTWTTPLATNVASYSDSHATVQVWRVGTITGSLKPDPLEVYGTEAVELVWQDGDWKYLRQTTSDGPTPLQDPNSTVTPGKDLLAQVQGWERFWHAPLPR